MVVNFYNVVLGGNPDPEKQSQSDNYWLLTCHNDLIKYFDMNPAEFQIRDPRDHIDIGDIFKRLQVICGVELNQSTLEAIVAQGKMKILERQKQSGEATSRERSGSVDGDGSHVTVLRCASENWLPDEVKGINERDALELSSNEFESLLNLEISGNEGRQSKSYFISFGHKCVYTICV